MAQKKKRRKMSKKMMRRRRQRRRLIFGLVFLCLAVVTGAAYLILYKYVSQYPENIICKNIYIGTADVSGMTKEEALDEMEGHLSKDKEIKMTMQVGEKAKETTLEKMGLAYKDIRKVVDSALSYGKEGTIWERYRKIRELKKKKKVFGEEMVLDKKKAKSVIKKKAVPLANHATDASIKRVSGRFVISDEQEGETVDIEKSIQSITAYLNDVEWGHRDFSMIMAMKKEKPSIKAKDLKQIKDELGTFSTNAGGGQRWKNLKAGVEKLNGTVLMPGEEASVHDITAPYDEEHGYVAAGSYENGQVVETYGGGICQVSTTLYNALLFSEVEIVKRYPHSMVVSYIEPSRDAAIAGDTKDLQFKNNYDAPIFIEGKIDGANQLTFTIYGKDTRDKGRSVEFISETISTEESGVTYKANPDAAIGSIQNTGSPHTGKEARLWKVVYQDGEEIRRDVINNSSYKKSDQIVEVGTASANARASALVRDAVASQNKEKINQAISQAKAL